MKFIDFAIAAFLAGFLVVLLHGCAAEEMGMSSLAPATASAGYDQLVVADHAVAVTADVTPVVPCGITCDDSNPCTTDTCDTATGQCVNTWAQGCMPCNPGEECGGVVQTCHAGDPLWHYDGWMGKCQNNGTCPELHKTVECDDGDPCTLELGCGYDDGDDVCLVKPIAGCKP